MAKKKRFVINDEAKENCYGFHVLTAGIELSDFKANPVCLHDHRNTTKHVLGAWEDLKMQDGELLGSPNFDTEDPEGKEVVRKVGNGTIKACSMGIFFNEKDMQLKGGKVVLEKCKLYEVSIVAVPANANAITLYNQNGEMMSEDKVKNLCLSLQNSKQSHNTENMKTVKAHLKLDESADGKAMLSAIQGIEAKLSATANERDDYKQKVAELQKRVDEVETAEAKTLIGRAVELNLLPKEMETMTLTAFKSDHEGQKAILSKLIAEKEQALKESGNQEAVKTVVLGGKKTTENAELSFDYLQKHNVVELRRIKAEEPEKYAELVKEYKAGKRYVTTK